MPSDTASRGVSRRAFIASCSSIAGLGLAGCTSQGGETPTSGSGLSGDITITGSSTVYPLCVAIANDFQKKHPDVNISVSRTGSGAGFSNHFCLGNSDFNNASRPITKNEKQLCKENGVEWHEMKVATDALTVIVNENNDWVDCMTVEELRQIWKKNPAQMWSDVRSEWPDEEIKRFGAADTSGTFDYFKEAILGENTAHTTDYDGTEKDNLILQGVTQDKYAIGYFGYAYYQGNKDAVKALAIDNGNPEDGKGCIEPSIRTAKKGTYKPLSRPLFTYPAKSALKEKHIAEFARYYLQRSTDEQLVANQIGYVPNTKETMQQQLSELNAVIKEVQ